MICKEEALKLIEKTSKYSHALIVSSILRKLAGRFGEDSAKWDLVGLLHDLDVDLVTGDMTQHGVLASQLLREKLPEDGLYAIKCHDHRTGFRPQGLLDNALIVVDALVTSLEPFMDSILSVTDIHKAIKISSQQKPWLTDLVRRCKELGMTRKELYQITLTCL